MSDGRKRQGDVQDGGTVSPTFNRRQILMAAGAVSMASVVGKFAAAAAPSSPAGAPVTAAASPADKNLPTLQFGKHTISRLICGNNPFGAGSHLSVFVNQEMRQYYTKEQILKTLHRCEAVGISAWQSSAGSLENYRRYLDEGGKMKFLAIESSPAVIDKLAKGGCIGIAHHGEATDSLFKKGQLDKVNELLKQIRDSGLMVGVSTHMPDVVDAIESKGWDLDYYMTCVYERHRNEESLLKLLGHVPLPVGEVYLKSDPPRMFKMIQQTKRVCLAFKILAAGRLSERREWVAKAFQETFAAIKPTDGVIVGIYDRYSDQPAENAELVRRFGSPAK
jgi:hypothetical protein